MTKETIIQYIRRKLTEDYKGKQLALAKELGISQSTISRIASGETESPTLDVVQPLMDRFRADDEAASKKKTRKGATVN